ncbi:MAG: ABC transporter ATP-binding protein [Chloroflexota bacterium]
MYPAIAVERVGKRYSLGQREQYATLRDSLANMGSALREWLRPGRATRSTDRADRRPCLWALRDVSFEVQPGQIVGVIGRNGAGKSTLLRILTRITEPTEGQALLRGRVGSLLEVGTGFHPELTGRENVFLNAAILGMKRADVLRRLDDIVGFAEIDRFLDTPVKRYSSGMYMRLAFSVAAHLEPDIFLVDEVLAVGDSAFQKKCLGRMNEVAREGRTVLFVSHNLAAVSGLTRETIWLEQGRLVRFGPSEDVIREYMAASNLAQLSGGWADLTDAAVRARPTKRIAEVVRFRSIRLLDSGGTTVGTFLEGEPICVQLTFDVRERVTVLELLCNVLTSSGLLIFNCLGGKREVDLDPGSYQTSFRMDPNILRPGMYELHLYAKTGIPQDLVEPAIALTIEPFSRSEDEMAYANRAGYVRVDYEWSPVRPLAVSAASA